MYGRGGNDRGRPRFEDNGPKPVKAGDELDVTIEAQAARGDGIAKKDGFVIFVAGAKVGQNARIRISDVKQRYAVGQLLGEGAAPAAGKPASEASPSDAPEGGESMQE